MTIIKKETPKPLLRLDLQFFSEGEAGSGEGSQSTQSSQPTSQDTTMRNSQRVNFTESSEVPEYQGGIEPFPWEHQPRGSVVDDDHNMDSPRNPLSQGLEQSQQDSQQPESTSLEFDFGGRKVRSDDPNSIKGAFEDFQNAQRTIQQLKQQTTQYEQFLQNLNNMGALPNQQGQQNIQNQQPQGPSPERMQQLHDEYMNKMYDNKFEADKWWSEQPEVQSFEQQRYQDYVKPLIEPIQQERETNQRIQTMKQQYNDFDNYVPKMQEILDQRPELNSVDQIENVYWIAKAQSLENQPTLEQQLENPEFRQRLVQDDRFRNEVLSNYRNQKQDQQRQAPPMIGNRPGGSSPTFRYKAPRSIREAGQMVRQNIKFQ